MIYVGYEMFLKNMPMYIDMAKNDTEIYIAFNDGTVLLLEKNTKRPYLNK